MSKLNELRQKKAKLVADARAIHKKAEDEKRDMTAEERQQFDKIMDVSLGEASTEIDKLEKQERSLAKLAEEEARLAESAGRKSDPPAPGTNPTGNSNESRQYEYQVRGKKKVIHLTGARASTQYQDAFQRYLSTGISQLSVEESRSLQADSDAGGGYLMAPQVFVAQLIAAVDDLVFIRGLANVLPPVSGAQSVGIPTREADLADADWTTELGTGSEDTALAFGKRELKPHPFAKRIKISNTLIASPGLAAESIVRDRLAYKKGITEEKGFLTGSGSGQPLGVFTASADGVSTARDVSTGNTTTTIGADNLIEAKYSLKAPYWTRASWIFHRDALKQISKLKDGDGQYLWRVGLTGTDPDTLLGRPVYMSEYAPNTFTTGLYVGMLGDFGQYWIVDSLAMSIKVVDQLYAETNQTGYIMRAQTDGQPVLAEAFARLKLA